MNKARKSQLWLASIAAVPVMLVLIAFVALFAVLDRLLSGPEIELERQRDAADRLAGI